MLVIGGSGFVGSFLIKELKEYYVQNLDKRQSPFYSDITTIGDITNPKQINLSKETDMVILLAAEHSDDVSPVSKYYDVNVQGTKNVLDAMDASGVKNLFFTSSVAVYGLNKLNPDENHHQDPFNHYGKSKWQAEQAIKEWYDRDPRGKSVTILRPTVIFGERNRGNVYNLFRQISSGNFLMIGNGKNQKSMAYVGNVVSFIKFKIDNTETGFNIYNYTEKSDLNMNTLVNIIEKKINIKISKIRIPFFLGILAGYFFDIFTFISGKKIFISSVRVKKFCATTQFNSKKAHDLFDAPFTLEEGINRTIDHEFINQKKDDILFYSE